MGRSLRLRHGWRQSELDHTTYVSRQRMYKVLLTIKQLPAMGHAGCHRLS